MAGRCGCSDAMTCLGRGSKHCVWCLIWQWPLHIVQTVNVCCCCFLTGRHGGGVAAAAGGGHAGHGQGDRQARRAQRGRDGPQDFIFSHPAQVALLGLQFQWTAETQVRVTLHPDRACS